MVNVNEEMLKTDAIFGENHWNGEWQARYSKMRMFERMEKD